MMDTLSKNASPPGGYLLSTPVWGYSHTRCFIEITIPSLLSSGNLPSCSARERSLYRIETTPEDAELIGASQSFKKLEQHIKTVFCNLPEDSVENRYEQMSACHKRAIGEAASRSAALIFVPPDTVFADGAILALEQLVAKGKRAVMIVGLRTNQEATVNCLRQDFLTDDGVAITVQPRELMDIALANLHGITKKHVFNGYGDDFIPNNMFWKVDDEGLLGRCFHLHPLLVYSRNESANFWSTIDYNFVETACPDPDDWHIVSDSDEITVCELSPESREMSGIGKKSLSNLIKFSELSANDHHIKIAEEHIYLHRGTKTPEKWSVVNEQSDQVIDAVRGARENSTWILFFRNPELGLRRMLRHAQEAEAQSKHGRVSTWAISRWRKGLGSALGYYSFLMGRWA